MKKLLLLSLLILPITVYAGCKVYYTTYVVNGKTVTCECLVCNQLTECNCK